MEKETIGSRRVGHGKETKRMRFQASSDWDKRCVVQSNQRTDSNDGGGEGTGWWMGWRGGWMMVRGAKTMRRWQGKKCTAIRFSADV